jgi:hypothetical protein
VDDVNEVRRVCDEINGAFHHLAATVKTDASGTMASTLSVAAFLTLIACVTGCDPCNYQVVRRIESPDHYHTVVTSVRNCGTLSHYQVDVSIAETGVPKILTQLFVFDDTTASGRPSGEMVTTDWLGSDTLRISFDQRAAIGFRAVNARGIAVQYLRVAPTPSQ